MADVYATTDELKAVVAPGGAAALDDRLAAALILGSRYVDRRLGTLVAEPYIADLEDPYAVTTVACPVSWRQAALVAAVRFYKSSDVPFGVVGGLAEYAVRVRMEIPEVDLILYGQTPILVA